MKSYIIVALFCVAAFAKNPDLDEDWADFQQRYDKNYDLMDEAESRREIWESNLKFIESHNSAAANGEFTHTVGMNEYGDWTTEEFVTFFNGYSNTSISSQQRDFDRLDTVHDDDNVPAKVDWVNEGYVTEVKNQKQCGSCWAFSTTGSLEGQHFKKNKKLVSLSEQNLVDCDHVDHGCMGGLMENAYGYIKENKGIDTESSYPYTAKTGKKCLFKAEDVGATLQSYKTLPRGDEMALRKAVATIGPVSVAIDAGHQSFHFYKEGVYYEPKCSPVHLDHGVLAVGYGTDEDKDYWLVKNSWGTTWGMDGYIKMSRNKKNNCGIATDASYPLV